MEWMATKSTVTITFLVLQIIQTRSDLQYLKNYKTSYPLLSTLNMYEYFICFWINLLQISSNFIQFNLCESRLLSVSLLLCRWFYLFDFRKSHMPPNIAWMRTEWWKIKIKSIDLDKIWNRFEWKGIKCLTYLK